MPKKVWSSGSYIHASDIKNNNKANAAEAVPREPDEPPHGKDSKVCFIRPACSFVCCMQEKYLAPKPKINQGAARDVTPMDGGTLPPPPLPPPPPPPPVPEPSMPPVAHGKAGPREFVLLVWLVCFIDALHAGSVGRDKAKVPGGGAQAGLLGTRPDTSVSAEPCFVATGSSCRRVRPGLRGQLGHGVARGVRAGTCPHERRAGSQEARGRVYALKKSIPLNPNP